MLKLFSAVALSLLLSFTAEAKSHSHRSTHHVKKIHHVVHHARKTHVKHRHHRRNPYVGMASWYGPGFHGRRTASGERFNQNAMTAAHKTLPLGSIVRVTNLETGESVIVRINDRGPYSGGRIIDLSKGAARAIKMAGSDVVELTVLN